MRDFEKDVKSVEWFANSVMLRKLAANLDKKHWDEVGIEYLLSRSSDEVEELLHELDIIRENPTNETAIHAAIFECGDVANFFMMIANKLRKMLDVKPSFTMVNNEKGEE